MSHTRGSLLLWFHLQLSILLRGATSHIEFLLAGRKAVLMTFAIAARSRYTSGPLLQPFLVCKACKASVAKRQGQRGMSGSVFCEPLNRFACSPSSLRGTLHSHTPWLHPPLPLQWVSLWGGGGMVILLCFLSAWDRNNQELLWQFPLAKPFLLSSWLHL